MGRGPQSALFFEGPFHTVQAAYGRMCLVMFEKTDSKKRPVVCLTMITALLCSACASPPLSYLDQEAPGVVPELFAVGVVNTDAIELNAVFHPDGSEFFFTRVIDGDFTMHRCVYRDGAWSEPEALLLYPGGEPALAVDMAVSPDGQSLYFLGRFPSSLSPENPGLDLWVSQRQGQGWGTASLVPHPVSTEAAEFYPCVVADGSLYYVSDGPGSLGSTDIVRAQRLSDGSFGEPQNLGAPVNSVSGEGDTFVAPDESYMILTSSRPGGLGQGDLYVSFRQPGGSPAQGATWSEPQNLGALINSKHTDFCPMVSPDGKLLFFTRRYGNTWETSERCEIYWLDASYLDPFRWVHIAGSP